MNKITIKALRYYDEIGLLKPTHIEEFTGYRYYSSEQLPVLHEILALRQMGFSLNEIAKVQTAACVLHKGSYSDFPKAYAALLKWIEENGFELIDNPRESYIDGIWNKDSIDDWLTEIQFPVRSIE